jgi:hypothetical protein
VTALPTSPSSLVNGWPNACASRGRRGPPDSDAVPWPSVWLLALPSAPLLPPPLSFSLCLLPSLSRSRSRVGFTLDSSFVLICKLRRSSLIFSLTSKGFVEKEELVEE